MYSPLDHSLALHLDAAGFTAAGQQVHVGTRPLPDGWVIAVLRVDNCTSQAEAAWLGACVQADVLTHMRFCNQQAVPLEAVEVEHGVPNGAASWSVAVFVTLGSMDEADVMREFLTAYAGPGLD